MLPISPSPSSSPLPLPFDKEQNDDNLNEIEKIQKLLNQYSNFIKPNEIDLEEEELILQPKISTSKALASSDKVLSLFS
ncbi:unnamed protein product [Rhizophagus irregularis]|nr:unnamed protein product [Rhizophagus irregularis]